MRPSDADWFRETPQQAQGILCHAGARFSLGWTGFDPQAGKQRLGRMVRSAIASAGQMAANMLKFTPEIRLPGRFRSWRRMPGTPFLR
ncbi:hypothetical protein GCM10011326_09700 [Salipiger profundus]|nr:hypothetical protein GCM10011326_09700 [Salipiger profundus]